MGLIGKNNLGLILWVDISGLLNISCFFSSLLSRGVIRDLDAKTMEWVGKVINRIQKE